MDRLRSASRHADRYTTVYNVWALMKSERNAEAFAVLSKLVGHESAAPQQSQEAQGDRHGE
jgi:hypothetical protein